MGFDIDVTEYVEDRDCTLYSNSVLNLGQNAAQITWEAAKQHVAAEGLLTSEQVTEAREWLSSMGCSDIETSSDEEINALVLQAIAADINELQSLGPEDFEECNGNPGLGTDGKWYYYIGE
jgi:hypothetical protein